MKQEKILISHETIENTYLHANFDNILHKNYGNFFLQIAHLLTGAGEGYCPTPSRRISSATLKIRAGRLLTFMI